MTFCDPTLILHFSYTAEANQGTAVCMSCLTGNIALSFSPAQSQGTAWILLHVVASQMLRAPSSGMTTLSPKTAFVPTKPERSKGR